MSSKKYTAPVIKVEDITGKDWIIGNRTYRFYDGGTLLVKSPGRQSTFNWEISNGEVNYIIIDRVYYFAYYQPTTVNELHLTKKMRGASTHILKSAPKQIFTIDEIQGFNG